MYPEFTYSIRIQNVASFTDNKGVPTALLFNARFSVAYTVKGDFLDTVDMCDIEIGEHARVVKIDLSGSIRRRMFELGLIEGTVVSCVGHSPLGDPSAYLIRGSVIAIRDEDARKVKCNIIG